MRDACCRWFVEGADHNNIEVSLRSKYFHKLRQFLANMGDRQQSGDGDGNGSHA